MKVWQGKKECDVCGWSLDLETDLYDAKTKLGPWATMCGYCFEGLGIGLGTGKGQKYVKDETGQFVSVAQ